MTNGDNKEVTKQVGKIALATKWSTSAELVSKLFLPISSLILARMLTPEEFGFVATITMVLSLSDIIADAGFQKYIIQHNFDSKKSLFDSANVAFWSNQVLSLIICGLIIVFRNPIASLLGCPGLGWAFVVASINVPLLGFSSIQSGILKRELDFKPLFYIRILSTIIPFIVTIPIAFVLRNFWALIIGTLAKNILTSVLFVVFTHWKPRLSYSFSRLNDMLSFSLWSMLETLSIWINQYVDIFFVGTLLSQYYLGLYKTSLTLVGQCVGVITSIFTPIIFSSLSRLQNNEKEFKQLFYKFQKLVAILVMPIGIVIFSESNIVTEICLGSQWNEAASFIGLWGLTSAISVASVRYCTELYRAKGYPLLCFIVQTVVFIFLLPTIYISAKFGFSELCFARSSVEIVYLVINILLCSLYFKISLIDIVKNLRIPIVASLILYITLTLSKLYIDVLFLRIVNIVICVSVYFISIPFVDKELRNMLCQYLTPKLHIFNS